MSETRLIIKTVLIAVVVTIALLLAIQVIVQDQIFGGGAKVRMEPVVTHTG